MSEAPGLTLGSGEERRLAERDLGRWQASVELFNEAERQDSRSLRAARRLGFSMLWLRRCPEARAAFDLALALAPTNLCPLEQKAWAVLASLSI